MAELVEYPLDDGGKLFVQSASMDAAQGELGLASPAEGRAKKAKETLESALAQVTPALKSVTGRLRDLSPDDLTVEFGLTLTADTGIIVARGGAEVHFTVTLAWSRNDRPTTADAAGSSPSAAIGGPSGGLVIFLAHRSLPAADTGSRANDGGSGGAG
jgi:hypothetical protein